MAASRTTANSDPSTLMVKNVPNHVTEDAFRDMLMSDPNNGVWACDPNRKGKGITSEVIQGQYFVNFVDSYFAEVALKEWHSRPFFPGVRLRVEPKMLKPGQPPTSSKGVVFKAWWDRARLWNGAQKVSAPGFVFVPPPRAPDRSGELVVEQPTNSNTASSSGVAEAVEYYATSMYSPAIGFEPLPGHEMRVPASSPQEETRKRPNMDSFSRMAYPPTVGAPKSSQSGRITLPVLGAAALPSPPASRRRSQDTDGSASKPGSLSSALDSGYHSPILSASSAAPSPLMAGPPLNWEWYEAVRYDRESHRDEWAATVMAYLPTLDFV